jgi:hypothetical protein
MTEYDEDPEPKAWFVFGIYPDGYVDVADVDGDVATHVSRQEADRMIAEQDSKWEQWVRRQEPPPSSRQP